MGGQGARQSALEGAYVALALLLRGLTAMNDTDSPTKRSKSAQQTRASERVSAQRKSMPRMFRTILLGTVAMVAGIIWLGDQYGVERQEIIELMLASAGFVLALTAAGVLGAVLIRLVRHVFNRRS